MQDAAGRSMRQRHHHQRRQQPRGEPISKACLEGPPCVAVLVGRWGSWPRWIPLLLRTMQTNTHFDFHILSDVTPAERLPPNVIFHNWSLAALTTRLHNTVGLQLQNLSVSQRFRAAAKEFRGSEFSSAKTNDLKPMWGEAFGSDLLKGYDWWGYMQEDVLLGNMTSCFSRQVFADYDVVSPYAPPFNASGVLMFLRNTPHINRLWRSSSDAARVLSDPTYFIFDEWWGESRDHFPAVIGREAAAGRLRLRNGGRSWIGREVADGQPYSGTDEPSWFGHDLGLRHNLVLCWWRGHLMVNARHAWTADRIRCFDRQPSVTHEVCIFHMVSLKGSPSISELALGDSEKDAVARTAEFVLVKQGAWVPMDAYSNLADNLTSAADNMDSSTVHPYFKLYSGASSWKAVRVHFALRHLRRLDACDDMADDYHLRRLFHLRPGRFSWCWFQRSLQQGLCRKNTTVQALCSRMCMICPAVHEAAVVQYPGSASDFAGSPSPLLQSAAYRACAIALAKRNMVFTASGTNSSPPVTPPECFQAAIHLPGRTGSLRRTS